MPHSVKCLPVGSFQANCCIYAKDEFCAVIDPGDCANLIVETLRRAKMYPEYIIASHGHFDHIGALKDLSAAFPRAKIAVHKNCAHYLGESSLDAHLADCRIIFGNDDFVRQRWRAPPPAPHLLLDDGAKVGSLTLLHTPGHSPCSSCFYDAETRVFFSGDTFFANGVTGRVDLTGGSQKSLENSLRRIASLGGNWNVYPGHGESFWRG